MCPTRHRNQFTPRGTVHYQGAYYVYLGCVERFARQLSQDTLWHQLRRVIQNVRCNNKNPMTANGSLKTGQR